MRHVRATSRRSPIGSFVSSLGAPLSLALLLATLAACASDGGNASRRKETMTSDDSPMPAPTNLRIIMQSKTAWAGALLEAVARRDYERIESNAESLRSLSLDSGFLAQDTLSYRTLAEEFRQEVTQLAAAARSRDQADVETAYHRVTSACFRCHEYVGSERYQSAMPGRSGM